jgi:thiamine-phosphate pyrophosphorylase
MRETATPLVSVGRAADGRALAAAVVATETKATGVIGLDTLAEICAAVSIPVVAIGGITAANAAAAVEAGCAGVAVVSAIFGQPDAAAAAAGIRAAVDASLDAHRARRR